MYLQGSLNLLQQWNVWRGHHSLPARQDIKPLDVKTLLRDIFILDVNQTDHVRFRLAGTRICAAFGRELRNESFLALWQRIDQSEIQDHLTCPLNKHQHLAFDAVGVTETGRELAYEIALFPLQSEADTRHILGLATPKALPTWFGAEALMGFRPTSARDRLNNAKDFVQPVSHGWPPLLQPDIRKVGHLTVYEGGKG